jgi:hypothetical protein
VVEGRFADARAHAAAGDLSTAQDRLDELRAALTGTASGKRDGMIHDARVHFYPQAIDYWRRQHPPELLRPVEPGPELDEIARGADISRSDVPAAIADAWLRLRGVAATAQPLGPSLALWEDQAGAAVRRRVETELSDSQIALFEAMGRLMIKEPSYQGVK